MKPTAHKLKMRNRALSPKKTWVWLLLSAVVLFSTACGGTQLLETKTVNFRCDSEFNEGLLLPVDLVFIPDGEKVDAVTGVSPDEWFDSDTRENWSARQTMSLSATNERNTIKVVLKKPGNTVALVIIADYRNLEKSKAQVIVLDSKAKENEDIFITSNGLLH